MKNKIQSYDKVNYWQSDDIAVIFFNRNDRKYTFPALLEYTGARENRAVYDIWKHEFTGTTDEISDVTLEGHSVLFLRLSK